MSRVIPVHPASGQPTVLVSEQDRSVNFVFANGQEARYVRRSDEYFIVYLSSHGGCDQACRFCHLTQTKQVEMVPTTMEEFFLQAETVLAHYKQEVKAGRQAPVQRLHYNWMARGEPLLNETLVRHWFHIAAILRAKAEALGIKEVRFKISTIMPKGRTVHLDYMGYGHQELVPAIYYSVYSYNPEWRRKWLPKALPVERGFFQLEEWQRSSGGKVVLHWPFIEGENDSEEDVRMITALLSAFRLETRFNLVRYNPYSPVQGKESSEEVLEARFHQLLPFMKVPGSKIIPRVGRDVFASCGTFVNLYESLKDEKETKP